MSSTDKEDWIKYPTKQKMIYVIFLWLISIEFVLFSVTDLFTESFFKVKNLLIAFSMLGATVVMLIVVKNYFKNKK